MSLTPAEQQRILYELAKKRAVPKPTQPPTTTAPPSTTPPPEPTPTPITPKDVATWQMQGLQNLGEAARPYVTETLAPPATKPPVTKTPDVIPDVSPTVESDPTARYDYMTFGGAQNIAESFREYRDKQPVAEPAVAPSLKTDAQFLTIGSQRVGTQYVKANESKFIQKKEQEKVTSGLPKYSTPIGWRAVAEKGMKEGMPNLFGEGGSLTKTIFDFDPLGETQLGTALAVVSPFEMGKKPQKVVAGAVGSVESYWNPNVPSFSGAVVGDVISGVTGKEMIAIERLQKEWGGEYMLGSILGDIGQSIVGGKVVSKAGEAFKATKAGQAVVSKASAAKSKIVGKFVGSKVDDFLLEHSKHYRKSAEATLRSRPQLIGAPSFGVDELVAPAKSITDAIDASWLLEQTYGTSGVTAKQIASMSDEATDFLAFHQASAGKKTVAVFSKGGTKTAGIISAYGPEEVSGKIALRGVSEIDEPLKTISMKGLSIKDVGLISPPDPDTLKIGSTIFGKTKATLSGTTLSSTRGKLVSITQITKPDPIALQLSKLIPKKVMLAPYAYNIKPLVPWSGILGLTSVATAKAVTQKSEMFSPIKETSPFTVKQFPSIIPKAVTKQDVATTKPASLTVKPFPSISQIPTTLSTTKPSTNIFTETVTQVPSEKIIPLDAMKPQPIFYIPPKQKEKQTPILDVEQVVTPDIKILQTPDIIFDPRQDIIQPQDQGTKPAYIQDTMPKITPMQMTETALETPQKTYAPRILYQPTFLLPPSIFRKDYMPIKPRHKTNIFTYKLKKQKLKYPIIAPYKLAKQEGYGKFSKAILKIDKVNMKLEKMTNPFAPKKIGKKNKWGKIR